jgi:hypothetical protein
MEFEELKKRTAGGGYEGELMRKYEESLRQVESFMRENEVLKDNLAKLRIEYQQTLSAKAQEMDELQRRLRESAAQSARG